MKILLTTLNAKYSHTNLALKYLYMAGEGICENLEIKEFTINNSRDYVFTELVSGGYSVICFSCYIWNIEQTLDLCADLRKAQPKLKIILGGPEVSFDAEKFVLKHKFLDLVMVGEGENIFKELCQVFEGKLNIVQVKGIIYRNEGKIFVNPPALPVNFEEVPFPYEMFPCEKNKRIYYESSRGCPYHCSYCISSLEKGVRALSVSRVKEDLGYFIHKDVDQVKFLDRTFNWDPNRAYDIFEYIIGMDTGTINFHFEICADLLDERTLRLLQKARRGLFQFEIGIQSTNKRTLQVINRTSNLERLMKNIKDLTGFGNIITHVDLIAGLPFEEYQSFKNSFNQTYALGADNIQIGFLKFLKGTEIRNTAVAYQYEFMEKAPYEIISNECLSPNDICHLKQIEYVFELYYNRVGFKTTLKYVMAEYAKTPFDFFEGFSNYFYFKGFQHKSHKKEDLYRIFRKYMNTLASDKKLDEILEFDLESTMNFDAVKKFKRKGWNIL
ncbi:MAG: radical SAM protein [Anaerovoracaceae bacterium]